MDDHKREYRQEKRVLKRKGNQRVRRIARRTLAEHPDEAHEIEPDVGRFRTVDLNGNDRDATRRRDREPEAP